MYTIIVIVAESANINANIIGQRAQPLHDVCPTHVEHMSKL